MQLPSTEVVYAKDLSNYLIYKANKEYFIGMPAFQVRKGLGEHQVKFQIFLHMKRKVKQLIQGVL